MGCAFSRIVAHGLVTVPGSWQGGQVVEPSRQLQITASGSQAFENVNAMCKAALGLTGTKKTSLILFRFV